MIQKMPLSAVGMIAAHFYLQRVAEEGMDRRQLGYTIPGQGMTYGQDIARQAARLAWTVAQAVEEENPHQGSEDPKERKP